MTDSPSFLVLERRRCNFDHPSIRYSKTNKTVTIKHMGLHQRHSSSGNLKRTMSLERKQHHDVSKKERDKLPKPIHIGSPDVSVRSKSKRRITGQTVKKPAGEPYRSLVDDDLDFDKHFDKERCSNDDGDDDDYTWLSGGASPSTFFREYRLSGAYNVDSHLVSRLSRLADSYLSLSSKAEDKNSEERKTEDASTECSEESLQKGCKDELGSILSWTPDAEGIRAWSRRSCEEATHCSCSLSSLRSCHNSSRVSESGRTTSVFSSQLSDIKTNSMVSVLDEEYHLDNLPDHSCQSIWCSEAKLIDITNKLDEPASHAEHSSEALEKSKCNGEEPIFWPFDQNWNSEESWRYFSMSPLKDRPKLGNDEGNFTPSIGLKHWGRSLQTQRGCRRSIVFDSIGSKDSKNRNRRGTRNGGHTENLYLSRLEEEDSMKASAKVVPLDSDSRIIKQGNIDTHTAKLKLVSSNRNFWGDGYSRSIDLSIETVVGLEEFDGHEGIDSEFDKEIFVLDELC